MTATPSAPPLLAERADIHKSCKAIESLLNVLDDYGQVANAMATLEKKLAKAMRELAGLKVTGEIAGNVFSISANVFEASADVSSKFAKITDKEYDSVSTEVKKWFKWLAKEERAHDERLSSANARIKQARQAYEKRSRKNARDTAEEHARYVNLVSILGPEISKDKYEHGIGVTWQHMSTTNSVAACSARIADAEWLRACESIRRFSQNVGPLGEWRAFCEGGWDRPPPRELPDIDSTETDRNLVEPREPRQGQSRGDILREQQDDINISQAYPASAESVENLGHSPLQTQTTPSPYIGQGITYILPSTQGSTNQHEDMSILQPPGPLVDPNTGSVRSLSAFPTPPTHFPIPPPRSATFQPAPSGLNPDISIRTSSSPEEVLDGASRAETPTQDISSTPSASERGDIRSQSSESTFESAAKATESIPASTTSSGFVAAMRHRYTSSGVNCPQPKEIPRLPNSVADLAIRYQSPEPPPSPSRSRRPSLLIRRQNNTGSVAQIDELQHVDNANLEPGQPNITMDSEIHRQQDTRERERQLLERERELEMRAREIEQEREELEKARRDIKQATAPSGLSALAQQLIPRSRERRISTRRQQQQQLEAPAISTQPSTAESISSLYHTAPTPSHHLSPVPLSPSSTSSTQQSHYPLHLRHSQQSLQDGTSLPQSTGSPHKPPYSSYSLDLSSNRGTIPQPKLQSKDQHPPYCGCERCSTKYSQPSNPIPDARALRPPEQPIELRPSISSGSSSGGGGGGGGILGSKRTGAGTGRQQTTEKSKGGWIRRLSMPVGQALNLDLSKKNNQRENSSSSSLYALGSGIGNTPLPSPKGGLFSLDGRKNLSSTNLGLGRGGIREDGKITTRRSYEVNMLANRSMTNLGLGSKR